MFGDLYGLGWHLFGLIVVVCVCIDWCVWSCGCKVAFGLVVAWVLLFKFGWRVSCYVCCCYGRFFGCLLVFNFDVGCILYFDWFAKFGWVVLMCWVAVVAWLCLALGLCVWYLGFWVWVVVVAWLSL